MIGIIFIMTNDKFLKICNLLLDIEGGYNNDPSDRGGETYCGISRKFHPSWKGWAIVDETKKQVNVDSFMIENSAIKDMVYSFYKGSYWDISSLDKINSINIAFKIFDMNVNLGISRTAGIVQNAINLISQSTEIKVDNIIGEITSRVINEITNKKEMEDLFINILTLYQGNTYINLAKDSVSQRKFIKGWINRLHMKVNLNLS